MTVRRDVIAIAVGTLLLSLQPAWAQDSAAQMPPSDAASRMVAIGPENGDMAKRVGAWTVTETVWDVPGALPKVTRGLIAERRMVGSMIQETLRDPADAKGTVLRMDYLSFNRVEGRWEYVSMDTRAAVGIMTAQSVGRGRTGRIEVVFQPFALPGAGQDVSGQMLRMREEIISDAADHDVKDQYFTLADGTGAEWLAHRYDYVLRYQETLRRRICTRLPRPLLAH